MLYIKEINNKVPLSSTGNYLQCLVITDNGKESEKVYIYIYIYIYTHTHTHTHKSTHTHTHTHTHTRAHKLMKSESSSVVSNSLRPLGLYRPWNSPGQNTGVGRLFLLQGIFQT